MSRLKPTMATVMSAAVILVSLWNENDAQAEHARSTSGMQGSRIASSSAADAEIFESDPGSGDVGDPIRPAELPGSHGGVPHITTLQKCLMSAHALLVCIEGSIVSLGEVAKRYTGSQSRLVKLLKKWGGEVIKKRGKGNHVRVRMPNGRVETVPKKPGKGTVEVIIKRALQDVEKAR